MTRWSIGGRRARFFALALLASVVMPRQASAGGWEAWGGFSALRETRDEITFPAGWTFGAAHALTTWLSALADVDGQRKTIPSIGSEFVLTSHAFLVGGRASTTLGQFRESAQVTVGFLRASGTAFGSTESSTSFAIQPGLGLEYLLAERWSARASVDLRLIDTGQQVRIVGAVVYRR